jgi:transmembrane sensor
MKKHDENGAERMRAVERVLAGEGVDRLVQPVPEPAFRRLADHAEYLQAQRAWDELGDLKSDPDYAALLGTPTFRERLVALGRLPGALLAWPAYGKIGGAVAAAVVAVAVIAGIGPGAAPERFTTQFAETRQLALQDGTQLALGPKSAVEVTFSSQKREVTMAPGEAFFEVSHDPARPFVITAGDTEITVVGTRFDVKYDAGGVRVSVVEGLVQVRPPSAVPFLKAPPLAVSAGREANVLRAGAPVVQAVQRGDRADAWRTGELNYADVPLGEIVSDLNRYLPGEIRVSSDALSKERLTASFRADQAAQFLDSLPGVLPLVVQRQAGGRVVLVPKHP